MQTAPRSRLRQKVLQVCVERGFSLKSDILIDLNEKSERAI